MAFTLYSLIQTAILCTNAIAVLHEERFLSKIGWGVDQGVGGFGDDPGVKAQILHLIRSVRTVMRDLLGSVMASRRALKAVLIDLSGTLHVEDAAVPGAQEALSRLRQASVAVKFVTNTTKECKRDLLERLQRLHFDVQETEIFTSLSAARSLLEQKGHRPLLLVEESALEDFRGGFRRPRLLLEAAASSDVDPAHAAVVCVKASTPRSPTPWWWAWLQTTSTTRRSTRPSGCCWAELLSSPSTRVATTDAGTVWPWVRGPLWQGWSTLPTVEPRWWASQRRASSHRSGQRSTGQGPKPPAFKVQSVLTPTVSSQALADLGCSPSEAVMIGDDVRDDVAGAQDAGMLGVLVRTGKYRTGDEAKIHPPPHLTCDSFPQAVEHVLENLLLD
ncbi:unnamed protein product [Tetraodon nigroviridis]|uniref:Haloacid dehalogenase-like hydrolase domain-containing protein 2 n=1 Tax=Tetraodon nigroviridis TaxID=99883 RepID=Q4T2P7_TETNG|nr:unnamed protein product [Tetraodon nigroviridis]